MAGLNVRKDGRGHPEAAAPAPAAGPRVEYAKDSKGRNIGARQLDALAFFDITIMMGETASNQAALNQAVLACSTHSIDDELVVRPATMLELRKLLSRLGFEGYGALKDALAKFEDENPEAGITAAKN